jgi:hypothetical protein
MTLPRVFSSVGARETETIMNEWIEIPDDIYAKCRAFAERQVASGALEVHYETDPVQHFTDSKAGECAPCYILPGLDPVEDVSWIAGKPDDGLDLTWRGFKIDVKRNRAYEKPLLHWPTWRNLAASKAEFFILAEGNDGEQRFRVRKFIKVRDFADQCDEAPPGMKELRENTLYMNWDDLIDIRHLLEMGS